MATLINITDIEAIPSKLILQKGDMLSFNASGGHSISATNVVEMLGPFLSGYISGSGEIISPSGAPGMVLFYARQDGTAQIDIVTGDPFYHPITTFFKVEVL